ncbi:hypothetical protein H4R33_004030 [Dimargaris cristalligena]|uniref:Transcription factor CBF/NF-Y/archaeal histone domain-containing protein n=1 Tax=Dimargaris cristalligena TaxID=215637 RepID=A0A4Q0A0G2_9FUNG|nr:hypothetical protein H4R33_004030 [Dimargaris cristalligena]RKP39487.1 hypothetical protein BJ085DRAFT_35226 [Dimargaris cristalligena]|eukprot:RKP39487.1 hypothetical protein BJ085DRAFT_35226 [Dimargaris cristalligena]
MTKLYSRPLLRRILKAHQPHYRLANNVDILVYLDYILFLKELAREARQSRRDSSNIEITAEDIQLATKRTLKRFKAHP